tara:strand:- start:8 stop:337 length:330 start_codon:yes stop_codon:yes gene_type:complete
MTGFLGYCVAQILSTIASKYDYICIVLIAWLKSIALFGGLACTVVNISGWYWYLNNSIDLWLIQISNRFFRRGVENLTISNLREQNQASRKLVEKRDRRYFFSSKFVFI